MIFIIINYPNILSSKLFYKNNKGNNNNNLISYNYLLTFILIFSHNFTMLSQKELDEIDLLDLTLEEKTVVMKDLLGFSPKERKEMLKSLLEKKS